MTEQTPEAIAAPLAVELTIITGELWRVHNDAERWTQIYSPTAWLSLYTGYDIRGRVAIKATAPREMREPVTGERITCALDRTPEAIARDITARLLPTARAHLEKSKAYDLQKRKEDAAANLRKSLIRQFAPEEWNNQFHKSSSKKDDYTTRMSIDITNYNNSAEIKIRLPFTKALKLLKHIQQGEYIK